MKNRYEVRGEITVIYLSFKDKSTIETIVDTQDFQKANEIETTWCPLWNKGMKKYYAIAYITVSQNKRKGVLLHRFLMNAKDDFEIDHINHDTLDNRRSLNLREVTQSQNQQNHIALRSNNSSGNRGVYFENHSKKWVGKVKSNGKHVFRKYFDCPLKAEAAVTKARSELMPYSQEALK